MMNFLRIKIIIQSSLLVSVTLATSSAAASSQTANFFCRAEKLQSFQNTVLVEDKARLEYLFGNATNQNFVVNRATGAVTGKTVNNDGFDVTVLDNGNKDGQSIKILWNTDPKYAKGGYMHAAYLEIESYANNKKKPFVLIWTGFVVSGTCE